jgi:disulfide oxidoreductase YuzD
MPFYEFECSKGHRVEELVPIGTAEVVCTECVKVHDPKDMRTYLAPMAGRILSATTTDFHFNDIKRGRKKLVGPPPRSLGRKPS